MGRTRTDDVFPSHPNEPYTYPQARINERQVTEEGVRQYVGPIWRILVSETDTTGTVTLILSDVAKTVDPANPVTFEVDGIITAPTTHPPVGISGTYTCTFTKDGKHNTVVAPIIHQIPPLVDIRPGGETFDLDDNADVEIITVSYNGNIATVHVQFDTDTRVGANNGQYSFDGGTTWTGFTVLSDETGSFTRALNGSDQPFLVRGLNHIGTPGPAKSSNISATGVSIVAFVQISATEVIITYSGVNVTISIDGANPISAPPDDDPVQAGVQLTVPRDSNDHSYVFFSTVNGQTSSAPVHIPRLGTSVSGGEFGGLTNAVVNYTTNTIRFSWTWSGDSSTAFNIYVSEGGGNYIHVGGIPTVSAGVNSYDYTTTADIDTVVSPLIDIGFYVEAVIGSSTLGARSIPCVTSYGYNP